MIFESYINIPIMDHSISINEVWAYPAILTNLTLEPGKKLESSSLVEIFPRQIRKEILINQDQSVGQLYFDENSTNDKKITVEAGGELSINGGTVTKYEVFDFPWYMIELIGNRNASQTASNQPKVIFNNATISHGQEVVYPAQNIPNGGGFAWNTTGGYVQAQNTVFTNNRRVTGFLSYENMNNGTLSNNVSYFKDCDFVTDQNYLFPSAPAQLSFWQVDKVKIQGCNFINNIPKVDDQFIGYAIHSIQASFDVEKTSTGTPCTFSGFEYAVKSELLRRPIQTIRVTDADFTDNLHGAFFKNVDLNVFVGNTVHVPSLPDNYPSIIVGGHNGAYGYYNLFGTGFFVENNYFEQTTPNATMFQQPFGVIISHTGPDKNLVRRNTFVNFNTGIEAIGNNRNYNNAGASNEFGLQMLCNDFSGGEHDIYLPPTVTNQFMPQIISDVAHYQGGPIPNSLPAGNLFSHATNTIMDFENNGSGNVMYFHHDPSSNSRVLPRSGFTVGVTNNGQPSFMNFATDCASNFKTTNSFVWAEITDAAQEYSDLKDLYNSILDLGSTPGLLAQIYATPSSEYFELYVDLMSEPGSLSNEVVLELVQNGDFPNILLRNIVIGNPHLLQDDGFWIELENRSPAFTQTMLDEMWNGLANVSDLQLLFSQMGSALQTLNGEGAHALRSIGEQPQNWATQNDTLLMICDIIPNPYYKLLGHLHQKGCDVQYNLEDSVQALLASGLVSDVNLPFFEELTDAYTAYYNALSSIEPYSTAISPASSDLETLMLNSSHFGIRSLASAILMQEGGQNFPEVDSGLVASSHFDVVVYPGAISSKKARKAMPEKVKLSGSLSAYPNPTMGSTHLDYQFVQNPEEITVHVLSMDGRLVMQHSVKTNQPFGSMPLALDNLGTGFYIVTLSSKSGEVVQTKLVKQ